LCPANISESKSEEIKNIAIKIHQLSNCKVYSRVDFRLDKNNKCWLLEINTLPGMTETSLFPMAAKAIGLSFEDLIDKIIKLSIEK
jgi:D-alanine-D-alanine ligase|tara:strand:- start:1491 stop:1748 length:258 start_codon:yes stop_codon:yes gene_type:complete